MEKTQNKTYEEIMEDRIKNSPLAKFFASREERAEDNSKLDGLNDKTYPPIYEPIYH